MARVTRLTMNAYRSIPAPRQAEVVTGRAIDVSRRRELERPPVAALPQAPR